MIVTQRISSTTSKIIPLKGALSVNVLKWNNNKWKVFSPYYLKTDGLEKHQNPGDVLFENYWQGSKVFDKVFPIDVYCHHTRQGDPRYLWWSYKTVDEGGDVIFNEEDDLDYDLYLQWRDSLWACPKPVRYPNGYQRRIKTQFALFVNKYYNERRLSYTEARKEIYHKEYTRLVRKLPEYIDLLNRLLQGETLLIAEVDVPAKGRKGGYGKDCDKDGNCVMSVEKIESLIEDPLEPFGHGLCLAHALLQDYLTV